MKKSPNPENPSSPSLLSRRRPTITCGLVVGVVLAMGGLHLAAGFSPPSLCLPLSSP